ncbi:MAG: hypothetical protein PHZ25_03405 [Candidatus Pacebacteria bacterium]|nr:hypothetical protein [Candidatus Paceibacterota bacterium]
MKERKKIILNIPISVPKNPDQNTPFLLGFLEAPDIPPIKGDKTTYLGLTNSSSGNFSDSAEDSWL